MLEIHESWYSIKQYLYEEPLIKLNNEILPNIKYYPNKKDIFNVFKIPLNQIKVVILGQDPYHTPDTAIGYAFAVNENSKIPPSLRIIREELDNSCENTLWGNQYLLNKDLPIWKTLQHWSNQGVFLLNTALTVEAGNPGSHLEYWENFTKHVIKLISYYNPSIWLLWGKKAQSYSSQIFSGINIKDYKDSIEDIPKGKNYILEAPHPAASLYGGKNSFIGCNHFNITNQLLKQNNKKQIKW